MKLDHSGQEAQKERHLVESQLWISQNNAVAFYAWKKLNANFIYCLKKKMQDKYYTPDIRQYYQYDSQSKASRQSKWDDRFYHLTLGRGGGAG